MPPRHDVPKEHAFHQLWKHRPLISGKSHRKLRNLQNCPKVSLPSFLFFYPPKQQTTPSTGHFRNSRHPRSQILVAGDLPQLVCPEKSVQATRKKNPHCWIFTTWPFFLVFFCVQKQKTLTVARF